MLSESRRKKIEAEIEQAAIAHLHAKDADTALSHYADDIFAVSNVTVFSSRESLAADVGEYFGTVEAINHASWEDVRIYIINENAAIFSARFRYGYTSMDGEVTELDGVWTALFVLEGGVWKIRVRHESFEQI